MSRPTTTVLMLGGAKRVSLAKHLIAAGNAMGRDVRILSSEIIEEVPIACVGTVVPGPRWRDADAVERLSATIKEYGVDIVLPFVDGAIEICSQLKERHKNVFIPVSDFSVAHAMFDKAAAASLFADKSIAIPATYAPDSCHFPAILKPREGSASKGIVVAHSQADVDAVANIGDYLIQEYIADREEYTVDCYVSALSGKVKCTVPRLRISTSGGEVDRTQTHRIPQLIAESEKILNAIAFRGPVTLQFLHDRTDGRYLLMEINPRLGGGVVCSIGAGANIAAMILQESIGEEAAACSDWRDGALMARYFSEVMF